MIVLLLTMTASALASDTITINEGVELTTGTRMDQSTFLALGVQRKISH